MEYKIAATKQDALIANMMMNDLLTTLLNK